MLREIHTISSDAISRETSSSGEPIIDAEWVNHAVLQSVRLNSKSNEIRRFPNYRELPAEFHTGFNSSQLEIQRIAPDRQALTTTDQVTSILLNSNIRRGNRAIIEEHIPTLRQRVELMVNNESPVEIILPTLPFKDQNPLTTRHSLADVDLGEYLHFAQLRNIRASIEAVYTPGAQFTLLTDGLVYADFFADGQREQIEQYRRNCEQIRDELGLQGNVEIVDMEWLLQNEPQFSQIRRQIATLLQAGENPQVDEAMHSLQRGMLLNIPIPGYDFDSYASLISQPFGSIPMSLRERTREVAIDYTSFLLTMRRLNVVERNFPDALRATVHPKNAPQLPIHLVNKHSVTFPYNGVPLISENKLERTGSFGKSTRIMRFFQMLEEPNVRAIYQPSSSEPFYYLAD